MTCKAVILNDTSQRSHHGCARVMRLLRAGLETRGCTILATSQSRHDWASDENFLAAMKRSDVVVINGEGTLHHGRTHGERLLQVADHTAANGKKLVLLNALFDANPDSWGSLLRRFDLISARDSVSARDLSQLLDRDIGWVPDLSLSEPFEPVISATDRFGCLVGDAVRASTRRQIAKAAHQWPDARYLPTKTRHSPVWTAPIVGAALRAGLFGLYTGTLPWRGLPFDLAIDEADYMDRLSRASLHVTGRFHGVCLSLLTETPFVAVESVSGKVGRLLDDAGLLRHRLIDPVNLPKQIRTKVDLALTIEEKDKISAFLKLANKRASALFDEVLA